MSIEIPIVSNPNMLVPFYLMSNYLYDLGMCCTPRSEPVLSDRDYDNLCRMLDNQWDDITHVHKKHIQRDALESATGSYLIWDNLPKIIASSAWQWVNGDNTPDYMDVLQRKIKEIEVSKMESFILSSSDMDSIVAAKVLCKMHPAAVHLSASRKSIDFPDGSVIYLVKPYLPMSRIINLSRNYSVVLYIPVSSELSVDIQSLKDANVEVHLIPEGVSLSKFIWDQLFAGQTVPAIINYTNDFMLWEFSLPDTLAFHYGYDMINPKLGNKNKMLFDKLLNNDGKEVHDLIIPGREIQTYLGVVHKLLCKELSFETVLDEHTIISANISGANSLFFSNRLDVEVFEVAMTFGMIPSSGKIRHTLYAIDPDIDVSKIAKNHGGGGHPGAAGFTEPNMVFGKMESLSQDIDYNLLLDNNLITSSVARYIYTHIHGYQHNAFYGTYHGKKCVFYNTPYLTISDFFSEIHTSDCEIGVTFCLTGNGMYRIAAKSFNKDPLPDTFGKQYGDYRIDQQPILADTTFVQDHIEQEIFWHA